MFWSTALMRCQSDDSAPQLVPAPNLQYTWGILSHGKIHKKQVHMTSSCHVQTRPAYQDLSANVLSYLNQLDPARHRASRRHTPTATENKEHYVPGSWSRIFSPNSERIVSTKQQTALKHLEHTVVGQMFCHPALLTRPWPSTTRKGVNVKDLSEEVTDIMREVAVIFLFF